MTEKTSFTRLLNDKNNNETLINMTQHVLSKKTKKRFNFSQKMNYLI